MSGHIDECGVISAPPEPIHIKLNIGPGAEKYMALLAVLPVAVVTIGYTQSTEQWNRLLTILSMADHLDLIYLGTKAMDARLSNEDGLALTKFRMAKPHLTISVLCAGSGPVTPDPRWAVTAAHFCDEMSVEIAANISKYSTLTAVTLNAANVKEWIHILAGVRWTAVRFINLANFSDIEEWLRSNPYIKSLCIPRIMSKKDMVLLYDIMATDLPGMRASEYTIED